ncbi:MAG: thiol-disulfide oxidoreductase DCC family protein [Bacteroidia bacterium]|nr:thiol-disulfide oxidoreductase DCC family protein [Bacteroidia bacterium]MDW8346535.1 thiol-disulfide oxidoreductase DCC family protein [Bacteroidia bacterium]
MQKLIILYDGVCGLCNSSINYVIDHDYKNQFVFAPLQSDAAQKLLESHNLSLADLNTVILIHQNKVYQKSDAVLNIVKRLKGIGKILLVGYILPRFVRDKIYDFIAKHRYKWFGKYDSCRIPTSEIRTKFLL